MSHYTHDDISVDPEDTHARIAFVIGEFNAHFTQRLADANEATLRAHGVTLIDRFWVPGAFEIPGYVGRLLRHETYDLILGLGVVIQGDTPHFDYVCAESARGLMELTLSSDTPIINGILTCLTDAQVEERIGDAYALAGIKLLHACKQVRHKRI